MLSTQQIFWSIAIVASVLLAILLVMTLFEAESEAEKTESKSEVWFDARTILVFVTLFGWFALGGSYLVLSLVPSLLFSAFLAALFAFGFKIIAYFKQRAKAENRFDLQSALESTGQVLLSIPPHRNGFGKVQLEVRQTPCEMDAITAGQELQPGAPVRVIEVIDNRVLLVEPLQNETPPDGGALS